jgi:hypothetical protein
MATDVFNLLYKFKLPAQQAYSITLKWLENIGAKIKKDKPFNKIKATHGSSFKIDYTSHDSKKRIKTRIISPSENQQTVYLLRVRTEGAVLNKEQLKTVRSKWWKNLFQPLFLKLQKADPSQKEQGELSLEEIQRFSYQNKDLRAEIIGDSKARANNSRKLVLGIIFLVIGIGLLLYSFFARMTGGTHLIIIGTEIFIPGGISFGWILILCAVVNFYKMETF